MIELVNSVSQKILKPIMMRRYELLSRFLFATLAAAAISACGFIEIKPAYDTSNAGTNSEPIRASAPIKFHNKPQAPAATASVADNSADSVSAETSALVETAALAPSAAVVEEAELSEFPEVVDESSAVRQLTNSAEAPLIVPASLDLAQIATPVIATPLVVEEVMPISEEDADANSSVAASAGPEQSLLSKTATATITPNILVESQIPELAVEPADASEANTTAVITGEESPSAAVTSHTVVKDETVYSIANKYGVAVDELAELNSISPPNYLIYPDMVLKIGGASTGSAAAVAASEEENYIEHEVQEGETIYSISRLYQMQPEELARINDIAIPEYLIYPEMVLKVRSSESNSSDAATESGDWQWPLVNLDQMRDSDIKDLPGVLLIANSGDTARAASSGKVIVAGEQIRPISLMVLIQHDNDYISVYGYMQELAVNQGDEVSAGQALGRLDNDGRLYFEVRQGRTSVDVRELLGDDS